MRRVLMFLMVLGLIALAPASAASATVGAAPAAIAPAAPDPVGGMSLWDHMLTVTRAIFASDRSGMIDPTAGARERAFSKVFTNGASVAQLQNMMEYSALNPARNPAMTAEQYQLRVQDFKTPISADPKTGEKKLKISPTKGQKFKKGFGASVQALGAATFIPIIGHFGGNALGGWMGYDDVTREWCEATAVRNNLLDNIFFETASLLSGRDCSPFRLADDYEVNADMEAGWVPSTYGGFSVYGYLGKGSYGWHCYAVSWNISKANLAPGVTSYYWNGSKWLAINVSPGSACSAFHAPVGGYLGSSFEVDGGPSHLGVGPNPLKEPSVFDNGQITPATKADTNPDPERQLECIVTFTDGTQATSTGAPYKESSGAFNPPACPSAESGQVVDNISVGEVGSDQKLYDEAATPEYQQWATDYPECGEGACLLDLSVKTPTKLGVSCFVSPEACVDWWTDPAKNDNFQCTYGVHKQDIEECAVYAGIFKPGRVEVGAPYSDPMTGEWDGSSSAPRADGQAMAQGIQAPGGRTCSGMNVTGFDPVGFVMRPVQCALEWAFVPRPLVVEVELAGGKDAWEGKPPQVIGAAVANFSPNISASGCSRTVTIFSGAMATAIMPLNACAGSWTAPVAAISKLVTSAAMVVLVVVVLRRQISGMVGYGAGQ